MDLAVDIIKVRRKRALSVLTTAVWPSSEPSQASPGDKHHPEELEAHKETRENCKRRVSHLFTNRCEIQSLNKGQLEWGQGEYFLEVLVRRREREG
jgi:hypothetical protein